MSKAPLASTSSSPADLAFIAQQLFTGIIWVDDSLTIRWLNPQVEQLLAISQARLLNQSILALLAPEETEAAVERLAKDYDTQAKIIERDTLNKDRPFLKNAPSKNDELTLSERFIQAKRYQQPFINHDYLVDYASSSAHAVLIDYSVTPTRYQDQDCFIIEIWGKDRQSRITEEQRQQQQYEVARHMLRSVAHEVKNPLAGIRGAAQLLERQFSKFQSFNAQSSNAQNHKELSLTQSCNDATKTSHQIKTLTEKLHTYTDIIISETDRLTQLIGQLLGSNQPARWQTLNIHQPLEHVLALIINQYPQVQISRDYDLSLPELAADKDQLIQVFLNLLNNACESMTEFAQQQACISYQPQLEIQTRVAFQHTIRHQQHKQVLQIAISDNGSGIEPDLMGQIFFPMVTSRAAGTGLGLSIVQDIISRHHGMIEVSSKPNTNLNANRTCFTLYLPFTQPVNDTV